jgi:hypothetical protein
VYYFKDEILIMFSDRAKKNLQASLSINSFIKSKILSEGIKTTTEFSLEVNA